MIIVSASSTRMQTYNVKLNVTYCILRITYSILYETLYAIHNTQYAICDTRYMYVAETMTNAGSLSWCNWLGIASCSASISNYSSNSSHPHPPSPPTTYTPWSTKLIFTNKETPTSETSGHKPAKPHPPSTPCFKRSPRMKQDRHHPRRAHGQARRSRCCLRLPL